MKTNQNALGANQIYMGKGAMMNATKTVSMVYAKFMELVLMVAIILSLVLDVPKIVVLTVCTVTAKIVVKNVYLDSTCTTQLVQNALLNVLIVRQIPIVKSASPDSLDPGVVVVVFHNV